MVVLGEGAQFEATMRLFVHGNGRAERPRNRDKRKDVCNRKAVRP